jgi:hypothetical protein
MTDLPSCIVILEKNGKKYTKYVKHPRITDLETPKKPIFDTVISQGTLATTVKVNNNHKITTIARIGDFVLEGPIMTTIGLDVGTKTIVLAYKHKDESVGIIYEINGYWLFERPSTFIENMLNDPTKKRSDGTARPARWIKLPSTDQICVLGQDGEEFAYANNGTLLRPMAEGGITPDEESMTVLSSIVHGLLETAEKDLGSFDKTINICYCTTAPAVNKESNIDYHKKVLDLIITNYKTKSKISLNNVRESHAIVINDSPDGTGIGISWGAGTVTVSYVKYGVEIFSFCWVGSGDWIDTQVAMRHGYDTNASLVRKKTARETPTTVCKRKHDIDLTLSKEPQDRVGFDIVLHYGVLMDQVINGIIHGFNEHAVDARIEEGINVYMAGGTCSPNGFVERFDSCFRTKDLPFVLGTIAKSESPLFSVARGCLKAAEMNI